MASSASFSSFFFPKSSPNHEELTQLIGELKKGLGFLQSFLASQASIQSCLANWARFETNPAIRDIFGKLGDLVFAGNFLSKQYFLAYANYLEMFKEILHLEKELNQIFKYLQECKAKVQTKEKHSASTKKVKPLSNVPSSNIPPPKQSIDPELQQLRESERQAEIFYAKFWEKTEEEKSRILKEGLLTFYFEKIKFFANSSVIAQTEKEIVCLLPSGVPQLHREHSFTLGPETTDLLVYRAIEALNLFAIFKQTGIQHARGTGASMKANQPASVPIEATAIKEETDARDFISFNGVSVPEGNRALIVLQDGVSHPGEPLYGSSLIRRRLPAPPSRPVPPPRPSDLAKYLTPEEPLYVSPDKKPHSPDVAPRRPSKESLQDDEHEYAELIRRSTVSVVPPLHNARDLVLGPKAAEKVRPPIPQKPSHILGERDRAATVGVLEGLPRRNMPPPRASTQALNGDALMQKKLPPERPVPPMRVPSAPPISRPIVPAEPLRRPSSPSLLQPAHRPAIWSLANGSLKSSSHA